MKTVLITAIGSFSAITVIRACREEGCRVIGCDIYPAEWVVNSGEVDVFVQSPYAAEQTAYIEFLETLCHEYMVNFVMPLTDVEADTIIQAGKARFDPTVICLSSEETVRLCRDKYRTGQFLREKLQLNKEEKRCWDTIPGKLLSQLGGKDPEDLTFSYPLVLKPLSGRSSQGLRILKCQRELLRAAEELDGAWENYLVQPKLEGMVVTVDVLRDSRHNHTVCLPRRELLRTLNGAGTSVYVFRDEELEETCRQIACALNIEGAVNFEFIETSPRAWYFLECNPRFAGGVGFSFAAGYDMVRNHLNYFDGQEIEPCRNVKACYIARRYEEHVMGS